MFIRSPLTPPTGGRSRAPRLAVKAAASFLGPRARPALWLASLALLVVVASAVATTPTREEYVAQVDPICKSNEDATGRILKGARKKIKRGDLRPAGAQFARAAKAWGNAIDKLASVPQPPADSTLLSEWVSALGLEQTYLQKLSVSLKRGLRSKASRYAVRLTDNATRANNLIVGFGFRYCEIEPSKIA